MKIVEKPLYRLVADLFNGNIPNAPMLFSVLYGRNPGTVLVDDIEHPKQCVVRDNQGWTFRSQQVSQELLKESMKHLLETYNIIKLVSVDDVAIELPPPVRIIQRLAFGDRDTNVQLERLAQLPNSRRFQIVRMNKSILNNCKWKNKIEKACGDIDNFLKNGLGFCLIDKNGQIIAEAYAPFWGKTHVEIGIFTAEMHRGKGFATLTSAYLINEIEKQGYRAYWSCNADNIGSVALARKLGFNRFRRYSLLEYHT